MSTIPFTAGTLVIVIDGSKGGAQGRGPRGAGPPPLSEARRAEKIFFGDQDSPLSISHISLGIFAVCNFSYLEIVDVLFIV